MPEFLVKVRLILRTTKVARVVIDAANEAEALQRADDMVGYCEIDSWDSEDIDVDKLDCRVLTSL